MEYVEKQPQPQGSLTDSEEEGRAFDHCQWLYGDGRNREFCGDVVEPGRLWCRRHMEIVCIAASQRKKAEEKLEKKLEADDTIER